MATLEHGDDEQVDACLPVASHLDDLHKAGVIIDEEQVAAAMAKYPPLRRHHVHASYMPNMVRKIVGTCFASHRPGNRAIDPIGHILNKAWPMRCSVRNFSEIVSAYITADSSIYRFTLLVMHAAMLGVYPASKVRATVAVKLLLYRYYVHSAIDAENLSRWIQHNNHILLFVAIKEFIAYSVSAVPGLSSVLDDAYNWQEFVQSVTHQSDTIRATINQYSATPGDMFDRALEAVVSVRSYKCPTPPLEPGIVGDNLQAAVRMTYYPDVDVYQRPMRVAIYDAIREAIQLGAPLRDVAIALGIGDGIAGLLHNTARPNSTPADWRALRKLRCTSTDEALLLHEFVHAWTMCHKIQVYMLPQHIAAEQAESAISANRIIYACACCRQLRAFVVDDSNNSNAWACGHQKVLLDDVTGQVYCGKRIEKNPVPRRSTTADSRRSYWKAQQSIMCGYSPLLKIPMDGTLLSFYGKLYLLCPACTCVMRLNPDRYHGNTIRCVHCTYRATSTSSHRCFHCYTSDLDLQTVALSMATVYVCTTCWRRWMTRDDITSNIDEDTAHQAINERWSTNRVAVYCACI